VSKKSTPNRKPKRRRQTGVQSKDQGGYRGTTNLTLPKPDMPQGERLLGFVERDVTLPNGTTIAAGSPVHPVGRGRPGGHNVPPAYRNRAPATPRGGRGGGSGKPPRPQLPGPVHSEPGGVSPAGVLEVWAALLDRCKHPTEPVRLFFNQYLLRAAEAIKNSSSDQLAASWGYLFVGAATGDDMLALLARQLGFAQCLQVTREMVGAVCDIQAKVKAARGGKNVWIEESDLPVIDGERKISGFAWLDAPLTLTDPDGVRIMYRALSWCRQEAEFSAVDGPKRWAGVRITSWVSFDDEDSFHDPGSTSVLRGELPLIVAHSLFIPFGQRFALATAGGSETPDDVAWWLRTLWQFLVGQVVLEGHVERHARKRVERQLGCSITQGAVRVVTLRRASPLSDPDEPRGDPLDIRWTCRWTVDPFNRHRVDPRKRGYTWHQAVPGGPGKLCIICDGETSHVNSFDKGPSWAPFRTRKKFYRLAR
jgi:hypothetical protein